jgi:hypothetical protein
MKWTLPGVTASSPWTTGAMYCFGFRHSLRIEPLGQARQLLPQSSRQDIWIEIHKTDWYSQRPSRSVSSKVFELDIEGGFICKSDSKRGYTALPCSWR